MALPDTWGDPGYSWLPTKGAAAKLQCSKKTLANWISNGIINEIGIRYAKIGGRWYFEFSNASKKGQLEHQMRNIR